MELAFYDALHYLDKNLQQEQAWEGLNELLKSPAWEKMLETTKLRLERGKSSVLLFPQEDRKPPGQVSPRWFTVSALLSEPVQLKLASDSESYTGPLAVNKELLGFAQEQSKQLYQLSDQYLAMYRFITGSAVKKQLTRQQLY
ncbi:MAG: hypothetical protein AAF975_09230, partial [Spirochaetota bacterium]